MPGATFGGTRSTFGSQVSSRKHSGPSYGFGSGDRDGQAKVFVSHEHSKATPGTHSPGPAAPYSRKAAVGSQTESTSRSAPQWAFGTSNRFVPPSKDTAPGPGMYASNSGVGTQVSSKKHSSPLFGFGSSTRDGMAKVYIAEEHNKSRYGHESPGPMAPYKLSGSGSVGKQLLSNVAEQPSWVFGSSQRFQYDHVKRAQGAPGPGSYANLASVGPQVASTKPSTPRFGFGSSNRDQMQKVYISAAHEKASVGREAPGPGQYPVQGSTGSKQLESNVASSAAFGFGTAKRFKDLKQVDGPGPGSYVI